MTKIDYNEYYQCLRVILDLAARYSKRAIIVLICQFTNISMTVYKTNNLEAINPSVYVLVAGKSFRNLIIPNRYQIVFIIFRLIWHQTDSVRLVLNQS